MADQIDEQAFDAMDKLTKDERMFKENTEFYESHPDWRKELKLEDTGIITPFGKKLYVDQFDEFHSEITETVGINIDGEDVYLNIPTILGGSIVGTDSSLSIILENEGRDPETGEKLIFYGAEDEAIEGAKDRMRIQNSEKMISKMDSYLKGRF
jgi:hypothetical protein